MTPLKFLAVLAFIGGDLYVVGARVNRATKSAGQPTMAAHSSTTKLKCVITGPPETGLLYSSGPVRKKNCFTECKAKLYKNEKGFAQNFENAFEPKPLPKKHCGCFVNGENKLTLKLDNVKGHPHCTDRAQENCWYVYKIFMKMHEKTNPWNASSGCQPCNGRCNEVRIPIRIDHTQVAGLKQAAADGDKEAVDALELLERDSIVELNEEELDEIEHYADELSDASEAENKGDFDLEEDELANDGLYEEALDDMLVAADEGENTEVDEAPFITVSDYDEELARANALSSTTTSEPAQVDDLEDNLTSNDGEIVEHEIMEPGIIGVRCKVKSAKRTRFLWRTRTVQVSTCGSVEVPGVKYGPGPLYGEGVIGPANTVNLRCYKPEEAGSSAMEGEGICRIPRRKFCDPSLTPRQPENGGCRYGTLCKKKTYYVGDGFSAHGYYSTYTCRKPDETYY